MTPTRSKFIPPASLTTLVVLALVWLTCWPVRPVAALTYIRDIARPLGQRTNKLTGLGIVVGLKGTGDGGDFLATSRPIRALLEKLGNPVTLDELKNSDNAAIVLVTAELSQNGVRSGDQIDVKVHSFGAAKSLAGGTLHLTPLRSANPSDDHFYAWAQGPVSITNREIPTSGLVKNGADVEIDFMHYYIDTTTYPGRALFTLVLHDDLASFAVAKTVAMNINEEMAAPGADQNQSDFQNTLNDEPIAEVLDAKNLRILVPPARARSQHALSLFIADILNLSFELPDPEAAVVINENAGTIVITGSVEIAPVIVTVPGLLIRIIEPEPQPRPEQPLVSQTEWTRFDTNHSGGIKINELMSALDQLKVPVKDKINVLYAIRDAGALRGKIIVTD